MGHRIEYGLLVELVGSGVDNDRRVQVVVQVGWSSHSAEGKVPVNPSAHPVVQNLPQKYGAVTG